MGGGGSGGFGKWEEVEDSIGNIDGGRGAEKLGVSVFKFRKTAEGRVGEGNGRVTQNDSCICYSSP